MPKPSQRLAFVAAVAAGTATVLLAGCGSDAATRNDAGTGSSAGGTVTVFAAASLKNAFTQIAADHPALSVRFSFDGSNSLVDQLAGGARADVFASADMATMDSAAAKGLIEAKPQVFAANVLVLIVPRGNPGHITGLDGSLTGKKLVVCAAGVPCGTATESLAQQLGVALTPVSEETKVTDVRGKVESGEADAGLVYATDAHPSGAKVDTVPVPGADKVVNRYPIALVKGAGNPAGGRAFIDAVRSERGTGVLQSYGFRAP